MTGERWNHNIHYHPLVLDAVPEGAERALDVGCGEGQLARELRERVAHVTALDLDEQSLRLARAQDPEHRIDHVLGDVLTHPLPADSYDIVATVATLHHIDARAGLDRLRTLVRPGGRLVVIGLARDGGRSPAGAWTFLAGGVAHRVLERRHGFWEHPSPMVWPPPETYAGMRTLAAEMLPGMRFRRHLLWRYSLVWTRPLTAG